MIKQHKVVAALPAPLEADSVYFVRVGTGFDIYVTNGTGTVAAYTLNAKTIAESKAASGANADITNLTALVELLLLPKGLSFNANTRIYPESNGMKIQLGSPTAATGYITIKSTGEVVFESAGISVGGSVLPKALTNLLGSPALPWAQAYVKTLMMTGARNDAPAVSIASAATVAIGAAAANSINVTGTTTITGFDSIATGVQRRLIFAGALTLTRSATKLILPGGENIVTEAGDVAEMESLGGGNWRCTSYQRATGFPLKAAPASADVDGGNSNAVYLPTQNTDGGGA